MSSPWGGVPAASFEFGLADHVGTLAFFVVGGLHHNISTSFGEKDGVRCNIVFLDGPEAGNEFLDVLLFNTRPVARLRNVPGQIILARIGMGQSKGGGNAPVELYDATPEDNALAQRYNAAFPNKLEHLRQQAIASHQQEERKAQQGNGRVRSEPHPTHAGSRAPSNQWSQPQGGPQQQLADPWAAQPAQPQNQQGWNQPAANAMATQPQGQAAPPWTQGPQSDNPPF